MPGSTPEKVKLCVFWHRRSVVLSKLLRAVFRQLLCGLLMLFFATDVFADEKPIGILLSREIAPYVAMVRGFENGLGNQPVQRFFLDDQGRPFTLGGQELTLNADLFSAMVAVGPESLIYLQSHNNSVSVPLFFGMILNPTNLLTEEVPPPCGVGLNIPIAAQFDALRQQLPKLKRLGVLFDPANNQHWYEEAGNIASRMDLELIPLQIRRTAGRLALVGDFAQPDALMFIPDKSIISRAVIQYVIKQAVLQRIPVVGYNQFFLESGAALAFVIDYHQIGRQVAHQVETVLAGQKCQFAAPAFELKRNPQVWQALDLSPDKETP